MGDAFGLAFCKVLETNDVLWRANLTRNFFGERTGAALKAVASKKNTTLVDIGDTQDAHFSLGLRNRFSIQRQLDANREAMRPEKGPPWRKSITDPELRSFDFAVVDDEVDLPTPWTLLG